MVDQFPVVKCKYLCVNTAHNIYLILNFQRDENFLTEFSQSSTDAGMLQIITQHTLTFIYLCFPFPGPDLIYIFQMKAYAAPQKPEP